MNIVSASLKYPVTVAVGVMIAFMGGFLRPFGRAPLLKKSRRKSSRSRRTT